MMQTLLWLLEHNNALFLLLVFLISLCIGSFLNVVIYRTPQIMYQEMLEESQDFLGLDYQKKPTMSLLTPRSCCPKCQSSIKPRDNIPVIGWLLLKGKCRNCGAPIAMQYPMVELLTAILAVMVAHQYGVSYQTLALLMLTYGLIALSFIDFNHQLLPDRIVYPLLVLGLCVNSKNLLITPSMAIWGLVLGYGVLWTILYVFKLVTNKEGMGHGDLKLLACLGAWFGVFPLVNILFIASFLGTIVGLWLKCKHGESKPFAFGAYLALGGWITGVFFLNQPLSLPLSL